MSSNVFILGDVDGPHSTAIVVGPKLVLGCAHSLSTVADSSVRSSRGVQYLKYNEEYWVQKEANRDKHGKFSSCGRVAVSLHKFHVHNDWALFIRTDGGQFDTHATIARGLTSLVYTEAVLFHCPVKILYRTIYANELSLSCNVVAKMIQSQSSHHFTYTASDLVRGSSGGALQLKNDTKLLGMHQEAIYEEEYDMEQDTIVFAETDKRVKSEERAYEDIVVDENPPSKKSKQDCDSETVASLSGGNNGVGRALWLSKCKRLMYYVDTANGANGV